MDKIPDWLPDWRDERQYPEPKTASQVRWYWEFLRRNPEYQEDYERVRHLLDENGFQRQDFDTYEGPINEAFVYDPPALEGEDTRGYSQRVKEFPKYRAYLSYWLAENKYGLRHTLVAPEEEYNPSLADVRFPWVWSVRSFIGVDIQEYGKQSIPLAGLTGPTISRPEEAIAVFDLTKPLKAQFDKAYEWLDFKQKHHGFNKKAKTRKRLNKYPIYLRVLDAFQVRADKEEIIRVLYPDVLNEYPDYQANKGLENDRKAARQLRDFGYRSILNFTK
jgi:hypothetical protein